MFLDKFRKSLPKFKEVHGIEIRKLPLGAYLDAIDSIKNLPEILLQNAFPGLTPDEVLEKLKTLDQDMLIEVAGNLLVTVPEQALRFVARLIGVEYETLRNDPEIGLNGIKDIVIGFWQINDMGSFFQDVKKAVMSSKLIQTNIGSKN